jgi:hypothetical protein
MKQLGRALALCFLSAITAEFLLGDQWLNGAAPLGQQVAELAIYVAYYGSGAVLIREVVRRTGRGWPSILLLGLAFGVLEEGIVDESLFNPGFAGVHLLADGFIPALGIGGPWTIFVLSLHVIWSIGAPIAVAEALFPRPLARRAARAPQLQAPWLGAPGLVVAGVLFVLGGAAVFAVTVLGAGFLASPGQLITSAVVTIALIVAALLLPRRAPRRVAHPIPAIVVAGLLSSGYVLANHYIVGSPWLASGLEAAILAGGFVLVALARLDVLGLAVGAIVTYCWLGLTRAIPFGTAPAIEQTILVVLVLGAVALAFRRRAGAPRVTK